MGWLSNRKRRKVAEALADERMAASGGDVDEALGTSQEVIDRLVREAEMPPAGGWQRTSRIRQPDRGDGTY